MSEFINTTDVLGDVAVASSIIDRTITEFRDNTILKTRNYIFSHCSKLESVDLPICENFGSNVFHYCTSLKNVNIPFAKEIAYEMFGGCSSLEKIKLPSVETASTVDMFNGCALLKQIDFEKCKGIYNRFGTCASLIALVFRSEELCALGASTHLSKCYHFAGTVNATYNPNGLKDGYIYVPRVLVDSYKVATNWSTFADQIRALEDYTVDGTIMGELDESKI